MPRPPVLPPQANYMTLQDHAKYKYLISADGFTASCRCACAGALLDLAIS
jgi:hypothetical protein